MYQEPDQLQGCAGFPKIFNQNNGKHAEKLRGQSGKTSPKQQEGDRQSQTWEAVIRFHVKDPASSDKDTALKLPSENLNDHKQN